MTASVAYQILETLRDRLALISPENGYNTDAGLRVYLGRRQVNDSDVRLGPALNVYDVSDEVDDATAYGLDPAFVKLRVQVDAFISDLMGDGLKLAHEVIQDVYDAMLDPSDPTLGGLSMDMGYSGRSIEYPGSGVDTISVSLEFTTLYAMVYGTA
jgi:hypothetical protein